jgi:hypothetical protein
LECYSVKSLANATLPILRLSRLVASRVASVGDVVPRIPLPHAYRRRDHGPCACSSSPIYFGIRALQ